MSVDWMFDEAGVSLELLGFARRAEEALADARMALATAADAHPEDRAVVERASEVLLAVRRRLREIDAGLLGDAQAMLDEVRRSGDGARSEGVRPEPVVVEA